MTYTEIAERMGVITHRCEEEWGGTWGYRLMSCPTCSINGFKTEKAAIKRVVEQRFGGDEIGKLVLQLLLKHSKS